MCATRSFTPQKQGFSLKVAHKKCEKLPVFVPYKRDDPTMNRQGFCEDACKLSKGNIAKQSKKDGKPGDVKHLLTCRPK